MMPAAFYLGNGAAPAGRRTPVYKAVFAEHGEQSGFGDTGF